MLQIEILYNIDVFTAGCIGNFINAVCECRLFIFEYIKNKESGIMLWGGDLCSNVDLH